MPPRAYRAVGIGGGGIYPREERFVIGAETGMNGMGDESGCAVLLRDGSWLRMSRHASWPGLKGMLRIPQS